MPAKTNEVLIRRVIDAIWNRCELDVADELFASDYVNHDGLVPDVVRGPEAIKISVVLYRLAFPDLHIDVEELSTQGRDGCAPLDCPGAMSGWSWRRHSFNRSQAAHRNHAQPRE